LARKRRRVGRCSDPPRALKTGVTCVNRKSDHTRVCLCELIDDDEQCSCQSRGRSPVNHSSPVDWPRAGRTTSSTQQRQR